jgi:hypothetical protein
VPPPPAAEQPAASAAAATAAQSPDQVAAALRKIASHIGHPKKFVRASELLRQLLSQAGAVTPRHAPLAFSAIKAAMADTKRCGDPLLSREYSRLLTLASKHAQVSGWPRAGGRATAALSPGAGLRRPPGPHRRWPRHAAWPVLHLQPP